MIAAESLSFHPYAQPDKQACLEIFDSNTPKFFGIDERSEFLGFLTKQTCPYFIVEQGKTIIACGSYGIHTESNEVVLAWGMVHHNLHKKDVGSFLLKERLKIIFQEHPTMRVTIDTSQHSQSFFCPVWI